MTGKEARPEIGGPGNRLVKHIWASAVSSGTAVARRSALVTELSARCQNTLPSSEGSVIRLLTVHCYADQSSPVWIARKRGTLPRGRAGRSSQP